MQCTKGKTDEAKIIKTDQKINSFPAHEFHLDDIFLNEMKLLFASGLEHYLTTVHRLGNNATVKYIKILKRVLKAAVEQEWISSDPLIAFKSRYHESNREPTVLLLELYPLLF